MQNDSWTLHTAPAAGYKINDDSETDQYWASAGRIHLLKEAYEQNAACSSMRS